MKVAGLASLPLLVTAAVSVLPYAAGKDPALAVLRARSVERNPDPAALESIRHELSLPDGPVDAAWTGVVRLLNGDLGESWVGREPVGPSVLHALGVSGTLAAAAALVATLTAILLTLPTLRHPFRACGGRSSGRDSEHAPAQRVAHLLGVVPEFLLAAGFVWVAALGPSWPHTSGWSGPGDLVLPAAAVGLPLGGVLAVVMQSAASDALHEPWVRTWAAAGHSAAPVVRAALRRGLSVAGPLVGLALGGLLGGTVVVENVFGIPGLGRVGLGAVLSGDLPLMRGALVLIVLAGLAAGALGQWSRRLLVRAGSVGVARYRRVSRPDARVGVLAVVLLLVTTVAGLARDPLAVSLEDRFEGPSAAYPLGTDHLGRDLLARVAHGLVLTVGPAVCVTTAALVVALVVAATGRRSGALTWLGNAMPAIVVGLLVAAATGPGQAAAILAVLLVAWIPLATHGQTLMAEQREAGHVVAAVALGMTRRQVITSEMLPAVIGPLVGHAAARVGHAALALTGLAFLGLGAASPTPHWGRLLYDGLPFVEQAPLAVLAPTAALLLVGLTAASVPSWGSAIVRFGEYRRRQGVANWWTHPRRRAAA